MATPKRVSLLWGADFFFPAIKAFYRAIWGEVDFEVDQVSPGSSVVWVSHYTGEKPCKDEKTARKLMQDIQVVLWSPESSAREWPIPSPNLALLSFTPQVRERDLWFPQAFAAGCTGVPNWAGCGNPVSERPFEVGYLASNPVAFREDLFTQLCEALEPGSCLARGKCVGKSDLAVKKRLGGKWDSVDVPKEMAGCKVILACENTQDEGYVTEKIVLAFEAGAVPVYWGAQAASLIFNPRSFLDISRCKTPGEAVREIVDLLIDPERMETMKRAHPLRSGMENAFDFLENPERGHSQVLKRLATL